MNIDEINLNDTIYNTEKTKKQIVHEQIRELIVSGQLQPGTVLQDRKLSVMLNTSRTPVREAIQLLESEGLVKTLMGKGTVVTKVGYEDIARIYDVREYLEGLAARLSAQLISQQQIILLNDYFKQMNDCLTGHSDVNNLFAIDNSFHNLIMNSSRNDLLISIYQNKIYSQTRRITHLIDSQPEGIKQSHKLHDQILKAIEAHDPEKAEELMRLHIRTSKIRHLQRFSPLLNPAFEPEDLDLLSQIGISVKKRR